MEGREGWGQGDGGVAPSRGKKGGERQDRDGEGGRWMGSLFTQYEHVEILSTDPWCKHTHAHARQLAHCLCIIVCARVVVCEGERQMKMEWKVVREEPETRKRGEDEREY